MNFKNEYITVLFLSGVLTFQAYTLTHSNKHFHKGFFFVFCILLIFFYESSKYKVVQIKYTGDIYCLMCRHTALEDNIDHERVSIIQSALQSIPYIPFSVRSCLKSLTNIFIYIIVSGIKYSQTLNL